MDDEHSPVYKTMKALEEQGLHVAVAYHTRHRDPIDLPKLNKIDGWTLEAFNAGASWVSVVIVSDRPQEHQLTQPGEPPPPSLAELQREVIANRICRRFASATDLNRTTCGLAEEVGEFERARKVNDEEGMVDALADIMVYCLGGFEILRRDAHREVAAVVEKNKSRDNLKEH
jgi:NTP pyrophosphatase (non-canonical NTP hydrolase)